MSPDPQAAQEDGVGGLGLRFARFGSVLAGVLLAVSGCGSAGQEGAAPPKVEEPPFAEFKPTGNRYKRQYARYVGYDLPPQEVDQLTAGYAKDPRHFLGFVDPEKKYYEYYWIEDEWIKQESQWFDRWAKEHWLPEGDVGKFKQISTSRGGGASVILSGNLKRYQAGCRYSEPRADFYVVLNYYPMEMPFDVESQMAESFLAEVVGGKDAPKRIMEGEHAVACHSDRSGYIVQWPIGKKAHIGLGTTGEYPKDVIREWLKRLPSSLPRDWSWEKHGPCWVQAYLEAEMWKVSLDLPKDFGNDAAGFEIGVDQLARYFTTGFPRFHQPGAGGRPIPEKVKIWNDVVDWANSTRGRLEWDAKLKKFKTDETKPRQPDRWQKLDPAKVKGESELPKVDATADYPEYKEADDKARKSWEQALQKK